MDSFTGTKITRPEFDKVIKKLSARDALIVANQHLLDARKSSKYMLLPLVFPTAIA